MGKTKEEWKKKTLLEQVLTIAVPVIFLAELALIVLQVAGLIADVEWICRLILASGWLILGSVWWKENRKTAVLFVTVSCVDVIRALIAIIWNAFA